MLWLQMALMFLLDVLSIWTHPENVKHTLLLLGFVE